jgi:hypothetical protein
MIGEFDFSLCGCCVWGEFADWGGCLGIEYA